MARPSRYKDDAERVEARRVKTREYVRAHRARRKHAPAVKSGGDVSSPDEFMPLIKRETPSTTDSDSLAKTPRLSPSLDVLHGTPEERRSFHYFRQIVIPHMAGYIKTDFWLRVIPQASHEEPAIQHSIAAFASLHEGLAYNRPTEGPARTWTMYGLSQYCKAMKSLTELDARSEGSRLDVILACCTLFVCIELLLGNHETALLHIDRGIDIMNQTSETDKQREFKYVAHADLWNLMRRLDTSAALWYRTRVPRLQEQWNVSSLCPGYFTDLESALQPVCKMFHRLLLTGRTTTADKPSVHTIYPDDCESMRLSQLVDQYEIALNTSLDKGYLPQSALPGVILLRTFIAWLRLTANCTDPAMCVHQSQKILAYVQILLDGFDKAKGSSQTPRMWSPFTLDVGVLGPLCSVFLLSQDLSVKTEALNLMAPCLAQQEGFLRAKVVWEDLKAQLNQAFVSVDDQTATTSR